MNIHEIERVAREAWSVEPRVELIHLTPATVLDMVAEIQRLRERAASVAKEIQTMTPEVRTAKVNPEWNRVRRYMVEWTSRLTDKESP